jgi:phage baseplate assembly protein W
MASYGDLSFTTTNAAHAVRGLAWPCRINNTGGMFSANYNETSIRDSLIQLLLTQRGERPMRLDYGTALRTSVFAPMDSQTVENLESSIRTAIERYEPRVIIRSFSLTPSEETSQMFLEIAFSVKDNVFTTDGIYLTVNTQGVEING